MVSVESLPENAPKCTHLNLPWPFALPSAMQLAFLRSPHQGHDVCPFPHTWANFQPGPNSAPPHPQPSESFSTCQVGDMVSKPGVQLFLRVAISSAGPLGPPLSSPVHTAPGTFSAIEAAEIVPMHPHNLPPGQPDPSKWSQAVGVVGTPSQVSLGEVLSRQK